MIKVILIVAGVFGIVGMFAFFMVFVVQPILDNIYSKIDRLVKRRYMNLDKYYIEKGKKSVVENEWL